MIRILHVVHTMECGGIETMLMNIYRKIDKNKIQFDFLVNGEKDNYYTEEIESLGGRVINVTPKRENLLRNIRETIRVMREGEYSIVHIHQDSMIFPAVWCAKKAKIKKIITHAHTTSVDKWYRKITTFIGRIYIKKNANKKIACSEAAAKWIYGKRYKGFELFKNAIDAKKFRYSKKQYEENRNIIGLDSDTIVLGTCGRLSPEKNQLFLVDIFCIFKEKYPNSKLMFIGDGPEKEKIIEKAKRLKVDKDIIITGIVSAPEWYYKTIDFFILPSFYEGLPLSGVEAQASGVPCFFSAGVTKEIKVVNDVSFIEIGRGAHYWAEQIANTPVRHRDSYEEIRKAGYDIGDNVEFLTKLYLGSNGYGEEP